MKTLHLHCRMHFGPCRLFDPN
uniref:Uncharacterized protein n=1 Tax=Arundo donax TaxID=35708 RepID=A0A0A9HXU1_ARUDO